MIEVAGPRPPLVSLVTPALNEADNLPVLYEAFASVLETHDLDWEWTIVDDHSTDATPAVVDRLAATDKRVRGIRLSRNSGSHAAITCGLHHARGDCAIVVAADLQDPPEIVPALLERWRAGAQVVWAVRRQRGNEHSRTRVFAHLYHRMMRHVIGLRQLPASGTDAFLVDRRVVGAFRQFEGSHGSVFALVASMGYRQASVPYDKGPRTRGVSGWSLAKKADLFVDSVTSFSRLPIRAISCVGLLVLLIGGAAGAADVVKLLAGSPPGGWAVVLAVLAFLSGAQMLMLGALGEYLWRALDESSRRPRYLVESRTAGWELDSPSDRPPV
jgi:dolichol-phosphate mannosyltransferase